MTHPDTTQAANINSAATATVLSDVAAQMQRIEQARQRIQASSHAISSGALATPHDVSTAPNTHNDSSQQRVASLGRAMDQVLQGMQNQALADISGIMQQQAALRQFQQNLAREQQGPSHNAKPNKTPTVVDGVIDVEAKTVVTEPSGSDNLSGSPTSVT